MSNIRITTLVDNNADADKKLAVEHGLAFWLETPAGCVLFDTGQGAALLQNAAALGVDLGRADAIVLSHGHYDHTGGLDDALAAAPQARVFVHPAAFAAKFSRKRTPARDVGWKSKNFRDEAALRSRDGGLTLTAGPTEVFPNFSDIPGSPVLKVTGEIPRTNDFEDTGGAFFLDAQCETPDPLIDDQAMFFDSPDGTVVILGCAHSGVVNTLNYIRSLTGDRAIHAVIGGMHLGSASPRRITNTIDVFRSMNISLLAPAHCTGDAAVAEMAAAFPAACKPVVAGMMLEL